jgi:uncharacterized protein YbjT (DUF2867 family)
MRIAIVGASGFIGRELSKRLAAEGHDVVAIARSRDSLPSGDRIQAQPTDVNDVAGLTTALSGCESAFYLVHSMTGDDFAVKDAALASSFVNAAINARVQRIIYLGGLGADPKSKHLASRREVGKILRDSGISTVELRAAVILGAGSISFEMLRYLVERLPLMVCPRWIRTKIEPIALQDVLSYLSGSLTVPAGIYEVGCGEAVSYRSLMDVYSDARGIRRRLIVNVPVLSLRLSSYWVDFITPVDQQVSHALIESLSSEVVVVNRRPTQEAFGIEPLELERSMKLALQDQADVISRDLLSRDAGLLNGVYTVSGVRQLTAVEIPKARQHLAAVGGSPAWYGNRILWKVRLLLGNLLRERNRYSKPTAMTPGANVDWWTVTVASEDELVLKSRSWFFGEGWLGYKISNGQLTQTAAFRPRGVTGFIYWFLSRPIHQYVFNTMLKRSFD